MSVLLINQDKFKVEVEIPRLEKADALDFERNKKHVEKMREAGMEEYIRFK